jgi:hypothetical protein
MQSKSKIRGVRRRRDKHIIAFAPWGRLGRTADLYH